MDNLRLNNPSVFSDYNVINTNNAHGQKYYKTQQSALERNPEKDTLTFSQKQNKKDNLKIAAGLVAFVAAAAAVICAAKRGKSIETAKLKDICFEKGSASLKNGEKFTGIIKDTLKNGDKISLEYVDGMIQKSTRTGVKTVEKSYKVVNNEKIVKTITDGAAKETNITQIQKEVKKAQSEISELIANNAGLSPEEFAKEASGIKYKNNAQQKELDKVLNDKTNAIQQKLEYEKINKTAEDITMIDGKAFYNGEPYCGKVHHQLKNGDKAVLSYDESGKLIKSEVSGSRTFTKEYDAANNVKITENGVEKEVNVDGLKQDAKTKLREAEEAKKLARETALKERLEQEINDFQSSLSGKTDEEISALKEELAQQQSALRDKANTLAKEKGLFSSSEALTPEDSETYNLLQKKIKSIHVEQQKRSTEKLENIVKRPGDKPVATKSSRNFCNEEELYELEAYYDDAQCNWDLRRGKDCSINLELMDSAFKKAPALEEDAVVYRGVSKAFRNDKFVNSINEGAVINDPGFISTSTKIDAQFEQFADSALNGTGVLMRIKVPKGTKGILGGYNEYLLPRDSQIKVLKTEIIDGVKVADCEYILK